MVEPGDRGPPAATRAGGVGYLQTHQPEHPVMKALIACDREAFLRQRIDARRTHRLSAVRPARQPDQFPRATGRPPKALRGNSLRSRRSTERIQVLVACRGALAVIKGRYRFRLLVEVAAQCRSVGLLREWLAGGPKPRQPQARGGRRSAELPLKWMSFRDGGVKHQTQMRNCASGRFRVRCCASPRNDSGGKQKACRHMRRQAF